MDHRVPQRLHRLHGLLHGHKGPLQAEARLRGPNRGVLGLRLPGRGVSRGGIGGDKHPCRRAGEYPGRVQLLLPAGRPPLGARPHLQPPDLHDIQSRRHLAQGEMAPRHSRERKRPHGGAGDEQVPEQHHPLGRRHRPLRSRPPEAVADDSGGAPQGRRLQPRVSQVYVRQP